MKKLLADRRRLHRELPHGHARALGPRARTCCTRSTRTSSWCAPRASGRPARTPRGRASGRSPSRCRGYAHINGFPDGPPTLPPFALGDGVAALTGALRGDDGPAGGATQRRRHRARSSTSRSTSRCSGSSGRSALVYDQLGIVQGRTGNRAPFTAPRNAYLSKDGKLARASRRARSRSPSASCASSAGPSSSTSRGSPNHTGRLEHQDELDEPIAALDRRARRRRGRARVRGGPTPRSRRSCRSTRSCKDPQFLARDTITEVEHPEARPAQDAERDPAPGRDAGADPLARPGAGLEQHRRAARRARADRRADRCAHREGHRRAGRRRRPVLNIANERSDTVPHFSENDGPGPAA